jgi:DNA-binding IclR family transcriptional regulator
MAKKKRADGKSRQKVLDFLKETKTPCTPKQIASKTRLNRNSVRRLAQELVKEGLVSKPKRGLYQAQ